MISYRCLLLLALATTCYAACKTLETYHRDNIPEKLKNVLNRCAFFKVAMSTGKYWFYIRKIDYNGSIRYIAKFINFEGEDAFMEIPENLSTYSVRPNKEYQKYEKCT
ncbi:hypothetical protein Q1695_004207 [Nippostrongylus brasiliensis]|nr:hypothetical protein Q1695_004207 [Nippostrongylus brasiliensis]